MPSAFYWPLLVPCAPAELRRQLTRSLGFTLPSPTYRFRIQRSVNECSQDWRIWVEKSEVYLSPRGIGNQYKASFHSSGQCQVGLSSDIRKSLIGDSRWDGKSRLFGVWQAPTQFSGGDNTVLVELVFPGSYLDVFTSKPGKSVEILECPENHLVSINIVKSSLQAGVVLQSDDASFRELARLPCTNGSTISVLYRTLQENDEYRNYLRARYWSQQLAEPTPSARTYGSRDAVPVSPGIRALLWEGRTEPKQWHEASVYKLHSHGPP